MPTAARPQHAPWLELLTVDGQPLRALPLETWCAQAGITAENARGYYLKNERIPGAFKLGYDWYVPCDSVLIRRPRGGRR